MKTAPKIALFLLMLTGYFLLTTSYTSADLFDEDIVHNNKLQATTLALGQRDTANYDKISTLFSVYNLKPNGFSVGAIKITKDGKMNFKYRIKTVISNTPLCQNLEIEVWENRTVKYQGKLKDLVIDKDIGNDDNWIFFLELNKNDSSLKNGNCNFDLVFKTWSDNNPDAKIGFWDEKKVHNLVTTGNW